MLSGQRRIALAVAGLAVAASLLFVVARLSWAKWDPSIVADVGRRYTTGAPLPAGLTVRRNIGYDGQFFYRLSLDPFTTSRAAFGLRFDLPARRQQRILYPMMAWVGSGGGQPLAVPWALIGTNIIAIAFVGWVGAAIAQSAGRSAFAGLFFSATPGILIALAFDTSEVAAIALALGTLLLLRKGSFGTAAATSCLALFARETTLVIPIGLLAVVLWGRLRRRPYAILDRPVPAFVAVLPIVLYVGWQALLWSLWGNPTFAYSGGLDLGTPVIGFVRAVHAWSQRGFGADSAFFVAATGLVILLALASLRRSNAYAHEKAAFLITVVLVLLYQGTILNVYVNYLRAISEAFVLSILMLLEDPRRSLGPLGITLGETWGYLAFRMRSLS